MKKTTFLLVAFMLLGFSFAKAQLVTMYDLVYRALPHNGNPTMEIYVLEAPNQDIFINVNVWGKDRAGVNFGNIIFEKNSQRSAKIEDGLWAKKVGNRNHFVCIDSSKKKYVYAFFDDVVCPKPMDELNQKIVEKGFRY